MSYDEPEDLHATDPDADDLGRTMPVDFEAEEQAVADDDVDDGRAEARAPTRRRRRHLDSEALLQRAIDVVEGARSLPLSSSVSINRDEVLDLLVQVRDRLDDELREARWLRKQRNEYLRKAREDSEDLYAEARATVERLVERHEIVKSAEHRGRRIIEASEAKARRRLLETDDFCDKKLARFEIVLERTLKTVSGGREKLQAMTFDDDGAGDDPPSGDLRL